MLFPSWWQSNGSTMNVTVEMVALNNGLHCRDLMIPSLESCRVSMLFCISECGEQMSSPRDIYPTETLRPPSTSGPIISKPAKNIMPFVISQ